MINSVTIAEQAVAAGSNVLFTTDRIRTRACQCPQSGWLYHDPGSGLFTISKPGYYKVTYNIDAVTAAGDLVAFGITYNGEPVGGSISSFNVPVEIVSHYGNESIIYVPFGAFATIALKNVSAQEITATNANIIITRLA